MAKTIGERLREAREQKSLSIEDVAHATRIHSNTLRGLEEDDYSSFASTTYAKSFLTLYSRHLEIDADEALEQFKRSDTSPVVSGANYIRSVAEAIEPIERTNGIRSSHYAEAKPQRKRTEQTAHPIFLGLFLILLLAIIPILYLAGKEASSPEEAWGNITRMTGGDDSGKGGEASKPQSPALEIDARPGTRVTPAAPMTRPTSPPPEPERETAAEIVKAIPVPPATQTGTQKATPVAIPIRATPIVAVPVELPSEEEAVERPDAEANNSNSEEAGAETETADDDPTPRQGDGDGTPNRSPGTATTASSGNSQ